MASFYRAFFRSDDGNYGNVMIDLLLDERRRVVSRVPLFGFWGKLNTRDLMPFIYDNDVLDFGDYVDEDNPSSTPLNRNERFADFGLADRIIAPGERFTIIYDGDDWALTLEKLSDIATL